jgi:hypothetical protein
MSWIRNSGQHVLEKKGAFLAHFTNFEAKHAPKSLIKTETSLEKYD